MTKDDGLPLRATVYRIHSKHYDGETGTDATDPHDVFHSSNSKWLEGNVYVNKASGINQSNNVWGYFNLTYLCLCRQCNYKYLPFRVFQKHKIGLCEFYKHTHNSVFIYPNHAGSHGISFSSCIRW